MHISFIDIQIFVKTYCVLKTKSKQRDDVQNVRFSPSHIRLKNLFCALWVKTNIIELYAYTSNVWFVDKPKVVIYNSMLSFFKDHFSITILQCFTSIFLKVRQNMNASNRATFKIQSLQCNVKQDFFRLRDELDRNQFLLGVKMN